MEGKDRTDIEGKGRTDIEGKDRTDIEGKDRTDIERMLKTKEILKERIERGREPRTP